MTDRASLPRGAFVLSLDFELIWGTLDLRGPDGFRARCELERTEILDRLLAAFVEFEIPATWLIVGHLFLDRCYTEGGRKHPEIVRPQHAWCAGDWFAHDPGGMEADAPMFLGRSLVEKIRRCPVPQEIGSHSFSHVIFGDSGCSEATAASELAASVDAARAMGLELRTFAFPRNEVGHLPLLAAHGFTTFRGPEPTWYHRPSVPGPIGRLGHLADVLTAAEPPVVLPVLTPDGLVDLAGSMVFFPSHGFRRFIPMALRARRALRGLAAAVRDHRVFHLWMHPTNMADETDGMFRALRRVLEEAARLRDRRVLDTRPMGAVAALAQAP